MVLDRLFSKWKLTCFADKFTVSLTIAVISSLGFSASAIAQQKTLAPINQRFSKSTSEEPDFRKHVSPILGKLGCNGRACHGSFQGQGGFQLSLFGFDFEKDHKSLLEDGTGRVDTDDPESSLILEKPADADLHEGGKHYEEDSWEYRVIQSWIAAGAKLESNPQKPLKLLKLEVHPPQINWPYDPAKLPRLKGQKKSDAQWNVSTNGSKSSRNELKGTILKVVATWSDGKVEDVTPLSRFSAADDQVAVVSKDGLVSPGVAGSSSVIVSFDRQVVTVPVLRPFSKRAWSEKPSQTLVDLQIDRKLELLGIEPAKICDDQTFLRRVMLDLTGTLPSPNQVISFQNDKREKKREILVEKLLKSPAYAAWWATRMSDWTGNNPRQLNNTTFDNLNASRQWQAWLQKRFKDNVPYDQIVAGIVTAGTREPGETYREYCETMTKAHKDINEFVKRDSMPYYWMRRDFRQADERAISFAHAFLGVRIQCAQCHKHPFDRWTQKDFQEFSDLFRFTVLRRGEQGETSAEAREILQDLNIDTKGLRGNQLRRQLRKELNQGNVVPFPQLALVNRVPKVRPKPGKRPNRRNAIVPDYAGRMLGADEETIFEINIDPRHDLMRWLRNDPNHQMARAMVNRIWENYFGRGLVHPVDDFSQGNAPSHPELLNQLTSGFVESGYDLHWLHRQMIFSDAYQRDWTPNSTNKYPQQNFARYRLNRIPSEVLVDAIAISTSNNEAAKTSLGQVKGRNIDFSVMSRRNRNLAFPLAVFGRSKRESNCDCDRSSTISLLQSVFVQNDYLIYQRLQQQDGWLKEIQAEMTKKAGPDKQKNAQIQRIQKALASFSQRLAVAKRNKNRKQIKALNQRIAEGKKRLKRIQKRPNKFMAYGGLSESRLRQLVKEIYLKTVSRNPTNQEVDRCLKFIKEDVNQLKGIQNVMHTLFSSKEFVMNH